MSSRLGGDDPQDGGERYGPGAKFASERGSPQQRWSRYYQHCYAAYNNTKRFLSRTKTDHWLAVGTWVMAFLTWLLVLDGRDAATRQIIEMKQSNKTAVDATKAANRAWIAPSQMGLNWPLELNGPVRIHILLENTGHEPAVDLVYAFNEFLIPYVAEGPGNLVIKNPNMTCEGLHPTSAGGMVIYPGKTNIQLVHVFDDTLGNRAIAINARDRKKTLVVEGCIAYQTFGEPHFSKFRFFLRDRPGASCIITGIDEIQCHWTFNLINLGNEAN